MICIERKHLHERNTAHLRRDSGGVCLEFLYRERSNEPDRKRKHLVKRYKIVERPHHKSAMLSIGQQQ